MAIKAPAWVEKQKAVPTTKGWKHPNRNEILLPKTFTQEEIDEYLGNKPAKKASPKPTPKPIEVAEETPVLVSEELEAAPAPEVEVSVEEDEKEATAKKKSSAPRVGKIAKAVKRAKSKLS